ncbi:hypothetical protein NDU88_001278 [Pleurodeles waltl]|uniref:Uncharacterized protein n=1 Tax=Pleurodeles waltl TaxID=8319 RepID=A0AAV7WLV1_PLEWA|nr:hypothetical protein NDU88_001278 [Pleurodeles waltl]
MNGVVRAGHKQQISAVGAEQSQGITKTRPDPGSARLPPRLQDQRWPLDFTIPVKLLAVLPGVCASGHEQIMFKAGLTLAFLSAYRGSVIVTPSKTGPGFACLRGDMEGSRRGATKCQQQVDTALAPDMALGAAPRCVGNGKEPSSRQTLVPDALAIVKESVRNHWQ